MHTDIAANRIPKLLLAIVRERLAATIEVKRLYESLQTSFAPGNLERDAGLTRAMLVRLTENDERHGELLRRAVVTLGGSVVPPDIEQPLPIEPPPRAIAQALRAILFAKLQDVDGWETLTTLTRELGYAELEHQFRRAAMDEQVNVTHVRQSLTQAVMEDPGGATEPS